MPPEELVGRKLDAITQRKYPGILSKISPRLLNPHLLDISKPTLPDGITILEAIRIIKSFKNSRTKVLLVIAERKIEDLVERTSLTRDQVEQLLSIS